MSAPLSAQHGRPDTHLRSSVPVVVATGGGGAAVGRAVLTNITVRPPQNHRPRRPLRARHYLHIAADEIAAARRASLCALIAVAVSPVIGAGVAMVVLVVRP